MTSGVSEGISGEIALKVETDWVGIKLELLLGGETDMVDKDSFNEEI